jgi:hypothetical protein
MRIDSLIREHPCVCGSAEYVSREVFDHANQMRVTCRCGEERIFVGNFKEH